MRFSDLDQLARRRLVFSILAVARLGRRVATSSKTTYKLLFVPGFESARWRFGKWRAWLAFEKARRSVPAYRQFLAEHGNPRPRARGLDPDLASIPVTTKENYVKRYSIESRCRDGRIPPAGVVIDESSGTSGEPNNWVRGPSELAEVKQALQVAMHHRLGKEPFFLVNAFALGPWATGMNVTMSMHEVAIMKSVGPDVSKIEKTLNLFGPRYRYVLAGYPPFLKTLVDTADVDWSSLDVTAVYGGEGMSEGMRDYLLRYFDVLYGSYGASDLEINLAAENDFTIAFRRLLASRDDLRERLGCRDDGLPMVFQYNPIDYYVETNDEGELVVTICRTHNAAPKIRYNLHDLGHVVRVPQLRAALAYCGLSLDDLPEQRTDLPLLFLYGRADAAVAYYGSKVTPANIDEVLFSIPDLAERVASFALVVTEDEQANKLLTIAFELAEGRAAPTDLDATREAVLGRLRELNQDFREASRFIPAEAVPQIAMHAPGTGPFARNDIRLKKHYVQAAASE